MGKSPKGIYHEKIGIFIDQQGNKVAFTGSPNETVGGLVTNFESIDVFSSWDDPRERVLNKERDFDNLWANSTRNLEIIEFSSAAKNKFIKCAPHFNPDLNSSIISISTTIESEMLFAFPKLPSSIHLRDYQKEALRKWFSNDGLGLFKMATGTGKTITALWGACHLAKSFFDKQNSLFVLVVCPYRHLVDQWALTSPRKTVPVAIRINDHRITGQEVSTCKGKDIQRSKLSEF